jgi:two-component system alkaline phosphatase synthesis response regulator PhoP/two-component system response regulator RpaA
VDSHQQSNSKFWMDAEVQLLVVSPDPAVLHAAERCLVAAGHAVLIARSLRLAQRVLTRARVDAICLDSLLPAGDVERLLRRACEQQGQPRPPLVMLVPPSTRLVPGSLPGCFQPASDVLVTKPIERRELTRAVARALAAGPRDRRDDTWQAGDMTLDGITQELLFPKGGALPLTPTEFRLLRYLIQRQGEFVPSEELLEQVWGYQAGIGGPQLVRAHVSNLRRKLRAKGQDAQVIRTVPYQGYGIAG